MLRFGYRILLRRAPAHRRSPAYAMAPADLRFCHKTADAWVVSGVVRELSPQDAASALDVSPSFVVKHPKSRLVVDISAKKRRLEDRPSSYDCIPRYNSQLEPSDHLCSWDISDAFFHVPLAPVYQRHLGFRVGDRVLLPLVLPFGMKLSPFVFMNVMRPVVGSLRSWGMAVMGYTDDFCGRPPGPSPASREAATLARIRLLLLYDSLGITVHPSKGTVTGTTALPILCFVIETVGQLILLPPSRFRSLVETAQAPSSAASGPARRVPFKALQRFTGKAVS